MEEEREVEAGVGAEEGRDRREKGLMSNVLRLKSGSPSINIVTVEL